MQLAHAIEAWVEAHGMNLSASTQRDIRQIAASVERSGWGELPCVDVDRDIREDLIEEATTAGTLSGTAVSEFLNVVLRWEADQAELAVSDDLGPTGAFEVIDDESHDDHDPDVDTSNDDESDVDLDPDDDDDESDDDEDDDEEDDDDDDDDEDDDEEEDDDDDDDDDDDEDDDDDDDDDDDEEEDDDDDDDESDDDDDESDDDDDDDDDDDESDDDDDDDDDDESAASFFETLGASSPTNGESTGDIEELIDETPASGGVFSAAAEHIPAKPASGIDWITVAYFTVAAICFALVIYFYLSS